MHDNKDNVDNEDNKSGGKDEEDKVGYDMGSRRTRVLSWYVSLFHDSTTGTWDAHASRVPNMLF